jgi:pilus assembly protein Flp/PilA
VIATVLSSLISFVNRWRGDDEQRGATLVEYALLVALIAIVCIVAITFLGGAASSQFSNVGASLNP